MTAARGRAGGKAGKGRNLRRLVLLGPPGSGKGTAASWLSGQLRVPHVSTGEIFRHEISDHTETGQRVECFLARGQLAPDDLVMKIVDQWLDRYGTEGFVLDGFPRTLAQARFFVPMLGRRELVLDVVVYLNASQKVVEQRVLGRRVCKACGESFHVRNCPPRREGRCDACGGTLIQREDDRPEMVRKRWAVFAEQTAGLVEFYRSLGLLIEVDADSAASEMCRRIWEVLTR